MLRRLPTARPRSRASWVTRVVPILAGNSDLSAPSSFEPHGKPDLVDGINHAFGPFSPERTCPGEKGALLLSFDGKVLKYETSEILNVTSQDPSEIRQALKTARDIWMRALWISRRESFFLQRVQQQFLTSEASHEQDFTKQARSAVDHRMKIRLGRKTWTARMSRLANGYLKQHGTSGRCDPEEARWLRELNDELVDRWWRECEELPGLNPIVFMRDAPGDIFEYSWSNCSNPDYDFMNYVCGKLRDRSERADSGADRPLLIQLCDPLNLAKEGLTREQGVILYAEDSYDSNEKWVRIWDGRLPGECQRTLVVPSRKISAALDFFVSTSYDADFENKGYVPMKDWLNARGV